jgi:hypothetical protein
VQVLQAGQHQLISLELDPEVLTSIAEQAGFTAEIAHSERVVNIELSAPERDTPLLLFDAADPANTGWFSRCFFYVDGRNGSVLQTPLRVANRIDRNKRANPRALLVQIQTELPGHYRLPFRGPLNEKVVYGIFGNFLNSLAEGGVGVCGGPAVRPLAGRGSGD